MNPKCWVTTSWDDGHPLDFRLAEMLTKYCIPATFYIPIRNSEKAVMSRGEIFDLSSQFEIGGHTVNHHALTLLSPEVCKREIVNCKLELENIIGKSVQMFCYPKGKYTKRISELVFEAGFKGARTAQRYRIDAPIDSFQMHTTFIVSPFSIFSILRHVIYRKNARGLFLFLRFGMFKGWVDFAKKVFDYVLINGGVWHLWGHSWEIEEKRLWSQLQSILKHISGHHTAEYITNSKLIEKTIQLKMSTEKGFGRL